MSNFADVQKFHDKFGLDRDRPTFPRLLNPELLRFRLGFMIEELSEFAMAQGAEDIGRALHRLAKESRVAKVYIEGDGLSLIGAFDALLDLNVVSCGTADFMGLPWEHGWDIVMGCNMAKKRALHDGSDSKRGSPFDVVKPAGWVGPENALTILLNRLGAP